MMKMFTNIWYIKAMIYKWLANLVTNNSSVANL